MSQLENNSLNMIQKFQYEFIDDEERDKYISTLVVKYGDKILNHDLLIKSANLNEKEEKLRQLFWKAKFNKNWILITKEIIVNMMGFKNSKDAYTHFIKQILLPNFKDQIDYKVVDKSNIIVQDYIKIQLAKNSELKISPNSQYYIVSGHCFKELMMKYSGDAREYFIKIESLAIFIYLCVKEYNDYMYKQKLQHDIVTKNNEINELKIMLMEFKKDTDTKLDTVINQNNILVKKSDILEQKLDVAVEDRVPKPIKKSKMERFVILLLGDIEPNVLNYHVIRGQRKYTKEQIKMYKEDYDNVSIIVDINSQPNSKNLYIRMREQLKYYMEARANDFNIKNTTEKKFIRMVTDLNNDKKNINLC